MGRRVLVADDEPLTTELLALILGANGYQVIRAYDGAEALRQAREADPDIVMLDVRMPGMDGDRVVQRLRQEPGFTGKVVVLFSSTDEQDVDWRGAGADLFLQKPIDIVVLPDVLRDLLEHRPGADRGLDRRA